MNRNKKVIQYIKEYQWSNILAMIKNGMADPAVCSDDCPGKLVVITGATSGIGRAAAMRMSELGARIALVARDAEKA